MLWIYTKSSTRCGVILFLFMEFTNDCVLQFLSHHKENEGWTNNFIASDWRVGVKAPCMTHQLLGSIWYLLQEESYSPNSANIERNSHIQGSLLCDLILLWTKISLHKVYPLSWHFQILMWWDSSLIFFNSLLAIILK